MISDLISLDQILLSFESTLKVEYDERETRKIIQSSITRLENAYKVSIDTDLYTLQSKNQLVAENLNMLLMQIAECLKSLSLYVDMSMFNRSICISLADVNDLGLGRDALVTTLKYLQDKYLYQKRDTAIPSLVAAVSNIDMCTVKRLFIIMLILERLGIMEGVSVIARFLYLGGLVV